MRHAYNSVRGSTVTGKVDFLLWILTYQKKKFFLWTSASNSILTMDKLIKRKLVVINRWIVCKCSCEIVEHLLLHCHIARELRYFEHTALELIWEIPRHVIDLLIIWREACDRPRNRDVWQAASCGLYGEITGLFRMKNNIHRNLRIVFWDHS